MDKVEKLYDSNYCIKNTNKGWRYEVIPELVRILFKHFRPHSVIDFGCGNGLHIANFKDLGAECFGVEGTRHYRKHIEQNYDGDYAIVDLRRAFDLKRTFELAICIEVLEHLGEDFARIAVENICRHADVLCVTASPINNARYHVNGKDKTYWIGMFESTQGFKFNETEADELQRKFLEVKDSPSWMYEDLMVFRR